MEVNTESGIFAANFLKQYFNYDNPSTGSGL